MASVGEGARSMFQSSYSRQVNNVENQERIQARLDRITEQWFKRTYAPTTSWEDTSWDQSRKELFLQYLGPKYGIFPNKLIPDLFNRLRLDNPIVKIREDRPLIKKMLKGGFDFSVFKEIEFVNLIYGMPLDLFLMIWSAGVITQHAKVEVIYSQYLMKEKKSDLFEDLTKQVPFENFDFNPSDQCEIFSACKTSEQVGKLVEYGFNVNATSPYSQYNVLASLAWSSGSNDDEIGRKLIVAKALLDRGADPTAKGENDKTAYDLCENETFKAFLLEQEQEYRKKHHRNLD